MVIQLETLDEVLKDCKTAADVDTLYSQLLQRMINRALEGEMKKLPFHRRDFQGFAAS